MEVNRIPFTNISLLTEMEVREGDVFISSGQKQGTTWSCYIAQQLLSNGNTDFKYLVKEVPWAEFVHYPDQSKDELLAKLNGMPKDHRRAFKTHIPPPLLPLNPRAKYLVCVRNPLDSVAAYYPFLNSMTEEFKGMWNLFRTGLVSNWEGFSKFIFEYQGNPYWRFTNAWWPHRFEKNVFMFHYSDLRTRPAETIKKISEFLGTDTSDAFIAQVVERTTFANMKKSEEKFEAILAGKNDEISVLKHGSLMRQGGLGVKEEVPEDFKEAYIKYCDANCINKEQLAWCKSGGELPKN